MQNGVYILYTRDGYRVAYTEEFLSLFGRYNDATNNYDINREALDNIFGECEVLNSVEDAQNQALVIAREVGETDDGIRILNYDRIDYEDM